MTAVAADLAPTYGRARWIDRPLTDVAVAWCWVPVALVQHQLAGNPTAARSLLGLAFLLSFLHQPLTLGLVYGDRVVFDSRRRLYSWTPLVALAAVLVGLNLSLAMVAVIAGLWNAEHTLMQRYGLTRIYGRKAGDAQGPIEKAMYLTWIGLALVWVAADSRTPGLVDRVKLGETNRRGVEILQELNGVARWMVVPVAAVAIGLAIRWVMGERALGQRANPAKHQYVAATAALIITIMVDPLAGFTAYVATHAIEYFVTVHRSLSNRDPHDSAVAAATATTARRAGVYTAYFAVVGGYSLLCLRYQWYTAYQLAVLVLGALHIFYDGFIWKLRRPRVAASLGIASSA